MAGLPDGRRHRHPRHGLGLCAGTACFADNTALADINIDTELARYIGAPGGAVAYKVGELKIVAMRARAEQALGDRFDIRGFHDLILAQGQLPMTLLDAKVDAWIAARKAG